MIYIRVYISLVYLICASFPPSTHFRRITHLQWYIPDLSRQPVQKHNKPDLSRQPVQKCNKPDLSRQQVQKRNKPATSFFPSSWWLDNFRIIVSLKALSSNLNVVLSKPITLKLKNCNLLTDNILTDRSRWNWTVVSRSSNNLKYLNPS